MVERIAGTERSKDVNLYRLLRGTRQAERPFLVVPQGRTWSYGEVFDLAARMGSVLRRHGVRPGDRVMARTHKSPEAVALYLAAVRIGAVYVPLNTAYTARELAFFTADAAPRILIVDPDAAGEASGLADVLTLGGDGRGSLLAEADAAAGPNGAAEADAPAARDGDDPAAILYTSGTTGRSKGAVLTHRNLVSNAQVLRRAWQFGPDDVLLHALPIFHVHGLFVALHCAMPDAGRVIFLPRFEVDAVLANLPQATVLMGIPTHYVRLLDDARFDAGLCRNLRLLTSGSAPMTEPLHRRLQQRMGHSILERYGMTEAGIITSNPYDGERRAGTVGFPLPGVEIRVVDANGTSVAVGEPGVVEVRGPNVFAGYWNLPDKTREAFRADGWLHTGDAGSVDAAGRLTLAGRTSDMIISGGLNVYPKEIETALDETPGIRESAVVGLPHRDLGEAVVAFVVCDGAFDEPAARAALDGLARFKHPKRFVPVDDLPRNPMGKVQKADLRRIYSEFLLLAETV